VWDFFCQRNGFCWRSASLPSSTNRKKMAVDVSVKLSEGLTIADD